MEGPCMISTLISEQLGINCCVLMGANIANEIAVEKFSEATVGYREDKEIAQRWVQLFNTPYFQVSAIVTNDNLDLGCAAVEHAASDKAEQTIDGEIATQLAIRRKHKESIGATFFYASTFTQGPMGVAPESLRPKPGRLSLSQQRVYEDFARYPWQNKSSQNSNSMPPVSAASSGVSISSGMPRAYGPASAQLNSGIYSSVQVGYGFNAAVQPLDLISDEMDTSSAQLFRFFFYPEAS